MNDGKYRTPVGKLHGTAPEFSQKRIITDQFLQRQKTEQARPMKTDALPHGNQEQILLVDDEEMILKMVYQSLTGLCYTVTPCDNGTEALEIFREKTGGFDLVITDMSMPGMTGDILASKILEIQADIPIIMITGHSILIDEDKAAEIGIRSLLPKPVERAVFARTIRDLIDENQ